MEDMYMVDMDMVEMDMVEMDMVHMDMMDMGPPSWPSYLTYRPELLPELLIWTTYLTYQGHLVYLAISQFLLCFQTWIVIVYLYQFISRMGALSEEGLMTRSRHVLV